MSDSPWLKPRLLGRTMRLMRILLFLPTFYLIWIDRPYIAAALLAIVTFMGWYNSLQMRWMESEEPYTHLWLTFLEGLVPLAFMVNLLIRALLKSDDVPWMLIIGTGFLLTRVTGHTLFGLSVLRQGKTLCRKSFWSKLASLSVTVTLLIQVLDLEHYQQISIVVMLLLLGAASSSFLYWYYRDPDHRRPLSVATQLTMSRIVLTPFFIWVFFYDSDLVYQNNLTIFKILALLMVIGFMVTDFLDGYLARKMGEVSTLGKYLDPFSDKISNMTIFLCFMASDYAPVWMVALIYFRESSVETLRTLAATQNIVMPARQSGKWKTAIQGTGILIILVSTLDFWSILIPNWSTLFPYIPTTIMGIITFITLLSGVDYFISSKQVLKKYV